MYELLVAQAGNHSVQKVIVAASQAVMGEGRYRCDTCYANGDGQDDHYHYPDIRLEKQLSKGRWEHHCPDCGDIQSWQPSDESVIKPCNQYALSKHSQEQIAIQLGKRYGIASAVMRYSIVQGPRQSFYNAYSGAMRIFALSLYFNRPPIIYEDGQQVRDFVNIKDVVDANLIVLENPKADYEVFNVGGGTAWTVTGFYEAMQKQVQKEIEPMMAGDYRYGDTRHIFSDTQKLQSLGWTPKRTVSDSISAYWKFLSAQKEKDDILAYDEKHMRQLNVIRRSEGQ